MKIIKKYEKLPLGLVPDPVDVRDLPMGDVLPLGVKYPPAVDYSMFMEGVRHQGNEGACVAFGTCAMKEYMEKVEWSRDLQPHLSTRMLYNECKKIDGIPNVDGTYIRSAMKVLSVQGVCTEDEWPYVANKMTPAVQGYQVAALLNRIKTYAKIISINELCSSLYLNGPCPIGFYVTSPWYQVPRSGIMKDPSPRASKRGGHCVCAVGCSPVGLKIKNSWGKSWAKGGYAVLSWKHVKKMMISCWSATDLVTNAIWST